MLKLFIQRPVLATVISILLVVLGIIGIKLLPVEQYPDIAPPTVRVTTSYNGANADAVQKSVIVPLEEQINGVDNMTYMTSTASNGGAAEVDVYFKQGTDPDMATVNVQNRVAQAASLLPAEVTTNGVTVRKQQTGYILFVMLTSTNPAYDDKFLYNYAKINLVPQLQRINGVGTAGTFSTLDYSMRVWLKPDAMKAYGLTTDEVVAAIQDQNIEAAPGQLGEQGGQSFQFDLRYTGKFTSAEQFGNIILRSNGTQQLRLKDVARLELGGQDYTVRVRAGGLPGVFIYISQAAGSNAQQVIKDAKAAVQAASRNFPPGVAFTYQMDASDFLDASIEKVVHTLIEAFILVFLVVFLFLQNFRATLIPAIAVPVAIIGTFFFLRLMGFSINLLTLFALVLAIGIVVDDAIVVVEAVHAKLEGGENDPRAASISAIGEIAPAIVSITLVMASVFVPVSFIGGTSGVFFKQFGLTLAVAIVLSAINALTLSPALCALFLRPEHAAGYEGEGYAGRFFYWFNAIFTGLTDRYRRLVAYLGKPSRRWVALGIVATFVLLLGVVSRILPTGFVPQEDSGTVMGNVAMSPGTSLDVTDSMVGRIVRIAKSIPGVHNAASMTGLSFLSGSDNSAAALIFSLDPWDKRKLTMNQIVGVLKQRSDTIPGASDLFFGAPTLRGFGISNGVELKLQDRTGGDVGKFYQVTLDYLKRLKMHPEVMTAMTTFNPNYPQKLVEADMSKIKQAGLTLGQVMGALQTYVGSDYVSNFNAYGKQYRVIVQAAPEFRARLEDLGNLTVRTSTGGMVPITEFLTFHDVTGPQSLTRFNLYSSMAVTVIPNYAKGSTSGDVIKAVEETALPPGYTYEFSGMSREEANSANQTTVIFVLCGIFVYLLLAALYESYILPLAVMFSLPIGLSGVFLFVFASMKAGSGITNNIYVQISLVMLIGLLAKNAILIVEFALQRRRAGMELVQAAIEGATARLRPILMTSFAFIFGLLPLALAQGAGAVGNRSIGISAIGGMLVGTTFGLVVIPVLFVLFQALQERLQGRKPGTETTEAAR